MERIVIIGSSGSGKTTLAKNLNSILKLKVYHLDRLFWKRGWKRKSREDRIDTLQNVILENQWIVEGSYLKSSEPRLEAADTIIFLDMPPLLCLHRIIKRHRESRGRQRRDLPNECTDRLTAHRIAEVLSFPLKGKKRIEQLLHKYAFKRIIRLHSPKEVEDFLTRLADAINKNNTPNTVPPTEERRLTTAARTSPGAMATTTAANQAGCMVKLTKTIGRGART